MLWKRCLAHEGAYAHSLATATTRQIGNITVDILASELRIELSELTGISCYCNDIYFSSIYNPPLLIRESRRRTCCPQGLIHIVFPEPTDISLSTP